MKKKVIVMTLVGVILVAVVTVGACVWNAGRDEVTEPTEVVEQLTPYEETIETEEVVESISDLEVTIPEENKFVWEDREVDYEVQTLVVSRAETVLLMAEPREDADILVELPKDFQFVYDAECYVDNVRIPYVRVTIEPNEELGVTEQTTGYLTLSYCDTLEVYTSTQTTAPTTQPSGKPGSTYIDPETGRERYVPNIVEGNDLDEETIERLRKKQEELGIGLE